MAYLRPDVEVPGLHKGAKDHERADAAICIAARRISTDFLDFLYLADVIVTREYWRELGYSDPEEYFNRRVGVSWRTVQKRLAIMDGIKRLPPKDQDDARDQLAEIGVEKAAIIAPTFGRPNQRWRAWVERARQLNEEDLQTEVSEALGTKRDGTGGGGAADGKAADVKWRDYTVHVLETHAPEFATEVGQVLDAGKRVLGTDSYLGVLWGMVAECKAEWLAAVTCPWCRQVVAADDPQSEVHGSQAYHALCWLRTHCADCAEASEGQAEPVACAQHGGAAAAPAPCGQCGADVAGEREACCGQVFHPGCLEAHHESAAHLDAMNAPA